MKPSNWAERSKEQRMKFAEDFANTVRGRYLFGQALAITSKLFRQAEHPRRELSNAEDMEMLGCLFEPYFQLEMAQELPKLREEGNDNGED